MYSRGYMNSASADIPIKKKYTACRNTTRPVHGSRDENITSRIPRAGIHIFLTCTFVGIPIRLVPHYEYRRYSKIADC
jgi:hypothetical protein